MRLAQSQGKTPGVRFRGADTTEGSRTAATVRMADVHRGLPASSARSRVVSSLRAAFEASQRTLRTAGEPLPSSTRECADAIVELEPHELGQHGVGGGAGACDKIVDCL